MLWFLLYGLILTAAAVYEYRRSASSEAYFLNGRRSKAHQVGFSIIASCVGGSATVGMSGLAFEAGTPAAWWLLSGAAGLVLLRVFMLPKVREAKTALTMPEIIRSRIGGSAHRLTCLIILIAWTAILAAQFSAMGRILEGLTGMTSFTCLAAGAILIVLYTWLGGQAAVIKSDVVELTVMSAGLAALLAALVTINPEPLAFVDFDVVNETFTGGDLAQFLLLIGGSYIVCPMLFARLMSAESDKAARRGTDIGIAGIVLCAVVITALGIEARAFVPAGTEGDAVLSTLVVGMPAWAAVAFFFVMASAILSSADSCLITAATVAANDIFKTTSPKACRRFVLLVAAAAFALSATGKSVLGLLLSANTMYTCAVVAPIFVTLAFSRPLNPRAAALTTAAAGILALTSELTGHGWLAWAAAAVSVAGSLGALEKEGGGAPEADAVPIRRP